MPTGLALLDLFVVTRLRTNLCALYSLIMMILSCSYYTSYNIPNQCDFFNWPSGTPFHPHISIEINYKGKSKNLSTEKNLKWPTESPGIHLPHMLGTCSSMHLTLPCYCGCMWLRFHPVFFFFFSSFINNQHNDLLL